MAHTYLAVLRVVRNSILGQDIGERRDLAYRRPETLVELKRLIAAWEADLARNPPAFLVR
jgi:hypothetical protein